MVWHGIIKLPFKMAGVVCMLTCLIIVLKHLSRVVRNCAFLLIRHKALIYGVGRIKLWTCQPGVAAGAVLYCPHSRRTLASAVGLV